MVSWQHWLTNTNKPFRIDIIALQRLKIQSVAYLAIPKSDTFTVRSLSTKQFLAAFSGKTRKQTE